MKQNNLNDASPRRKFLQTLATGTAALGIASVITPFQQIQAGPVNSFDDTNSSPEDFFSKLKGKHKIVFDTTEPHGIFPFAWPKIFIMTNVQAGATAQECNAVVVLRHNAIPYALPDEMWAKYNLGQVFKIDDPKTSKPSVRNPFFKPGPDDFKVPGIGSVPLAISDLQASGVSFCVCNMAITVYSAVVADGMKMKAEDVKADWIKNVLPGIEVMPSGVFAVGRAQEHGCAYCFVG